MTDIFLLPYHSEPGQDIEGARGQFQKVERAITDEEFPYDNGDDPSFFVENDGGRLTWGVCRPNVRTQLKVGDIVVFFSFTNIPPDCREVLYRLAAVATVEQKLDHRAASSDARLNRSKYINTLIRCANRRWKYDESDRREQARHANWFWRIADQQRLSEERFKQLYSSVYESGGFTDAEVATGAAPLAGNYILFSHSQDETFVAPVPPDVAIAVKGQHEKWFHEQLEALTVKWAKKCGKRDYLRTTGQGHVHPPIHFKLGNDEAKNWRFKLIAALKEAAVPGSHQPIKVHKKRAPRSGGGCAS